MAINSRAKGCRGERLVIDLIKPWWTQLEPEVEFARTPGSGGWQGRGSRGQSLRGEMRMSGDLMTTSHRFPFSVEVKNIPSWHMGRLCSGKPSPVWAWWCQCQVAAEEASAVPMLWFRRPSSSSKLRIDWKVMLPFRYAREVPICPPLQVWSARDLLGVDHGPTLPILFDYEVVVAVDPALLALAPRRHG